MKKEKKMDKSTWEELIAACHDANVDLRATYLYVAQFLLCQHK